MTDLSNDVGVYSDFDPYENRTVAIHDATKWLLGAFAAVGAVVLSGVSLSGLDTEGEKIWLAATLAFLALAVVAAVIFSAARVLMTPRPTLKELVAKESNRKLPLDEWDVPLLLEYTDGSGRQSVKQLFDSRNDALKDYKVAEFEYSKHKDKASVAAPLEEARTRLNQAHRAVQQVLGYAGCLQATQRFKQAQWAAGCGALCVFAFLLSFLIVIGSAKKAPDNPPSERSSTNGPSGLDGNATHSITFSSPMHVMVYVKEKARQKVDEACGCKSKLYEFPAWAIGGDMDHPELVYGGSGDTPHTTSPFVLKASEGDVVVYPDPVKSQ
jgi:hypothetical protein